MEQLIGAAIAFFGVALGSVTSWFLASTAHKRTLELRDLDAEAERAKASGNAAREALEIVRIVIGSVEGPRGPADGFEYDFKETGFGYLRERCEMILDSDVRDLGLRTAQTIERVSVAANALDEPERFPYHVQSRMLEALREILAAHARGEVVPEEASSALETDVSRIERGLAAYWEAMAETARAIRDGRPRHDTQTS